MNIGILDQSCAGSSGGASYTRTILASLMAAKANGHSVSSHDDRLHTQGIERIVFLSREGEIEVPAEFQGVPFTSVAGRKASDIDLDVVLPVRDAAVRDIHTAKIGWILDFQHCRLPELFTVQDLAARDALFELIAGECQLVIVSSENTRRDFEKFLPPFEKKVRVLPFPSTLWNTPLSDNPQKVASHYHLPVKFALVANQFWGHKNHAILPLALSILKSRKMAIPLVLTGMAADYRDLENRAVSEFFQACARLGVSDQIHFLGHLPYGEFVSLLRCSALVIQPSLFEGWNTTVEDAKALGRPLLCSDIPVHREQAPDAAGFFPTDSPEDLAALLATLYPESPAGPAVLLEQDSLSQSKARAARFGEALLSIAHEAVGRAASRTTFPSNRPDAVTLSASPHLDASSFRKYLTQKKGHLKDILGKLFFHIGYWRRNIDKLRHLLYNLSLSFHGQELGVLSQYPPRSLQREAFPSRRRRARHLPSISIVTPNFNGGQTLVATIESVIHQNYPQLEYAVVDGGSVDDTRHILARYKPKLSYCISELDDGQAHAIIKGFAALHGDIMAYLNSDDILMPGALSFVGNYFARHRNVDVIYGHRVIVDEAGQEVARWILPRHDKHAVRFFDYVPQETLFWRRSLYEKVGGLNPSFHFAMDWDLLLRFIAAGARIRRVPYFLACFRVHVAQKTHTLLHSVGEREKLHLLAREHPEGCYQKYVQQLQDRYRFRSSLCAILLKLGLRY